MMKSNFIASLNLNEINARRANLSDREAVAVWLMKWSGEKNHIIAAKLGINQGRIAEVLTEQKHVGSKDQAFRMKSG